MHLNKTLSGTILILICLLVLTFPAHLVYATETTDDSATTTEQAPEPTETIPPAYYEPIQTNEIKDWAQGPEVYAESAVVMDADTGTILYSKNADAQKYPASITKIMTALLAIENSTPEERVIFSDHAIWGIERDSSHIGIRIGENLSMRDCLYGIMLESANEVCLAVAEHISGTTDDFVKLMNERAEKLGCKNTHFVNPNGLPDEQHYTTAEDMALIAKAAFSNETFRKICGTKAYQIGWTNKTGEDRWLGNHHKMLWDSSEYYYDSCVGGKTGYTDVALNTLVTYATRDDMNLICVSMRTAGRRIYTDTATLLDYGFTNFNRICISNTKTQDYSSYLFPFPVGVLGCYNEQTRNDILKTTFATVPTGVQLDDLTLDITANIDAINRIYTYNNYCVGVDEITQPPGLKTAFNPKSREENRTTLTNQPSERSSSSSTLPSWKYLALALLVLAILLLILQVILSIRKHKRKKQKK